MTTEQINEFLDQMKLDLGIKTDAQLADRLDIRPMTIWRWRQGNLDLTKQIIISYLQNRAATVEV